MRAEEAAAAIRAKGLSAEAVQADVASAEAVTLLLDRLDAEREGVDVLVNNAAMVKNGLFALMPTADWNLVMETAMGGTFRMSKGVIRGMLRRRWGRIINVSSLAGLVGSAGQTNYTKSLATETGPYGVTVNCVAPGFVETEMISFMNAETRADFLKRIPARRFGAPEDISPLVSFLCTDGAGYLSGQTIRVDGGFAG